MLSRSVSLRSSAVSQLRPGRESEIDSQIGAQDEAIGDAWSDVWAGVIAQTRTQIRAARKTQVVASRQRALVPPHGLTLRHQVLQ